MKKKLLIFFLLFSTLQTIASADITPYCDNKTNQTATEDVDKIKIKSIVVKVDKYRKFKSPLPRYSGTQASAIEPGLAVRQRK